MCDKTIERTARLLYRDFADEYDDPRFWQELPNHSKEQWRAYARERLGDDE